MSTNQTSFQVMQFQKDQVQREPMKKRGAVTGVQDRSEVESMIQRYLELAQAALKTDESQSSEPRQGN